MCIPWDASGGAGLDGQSRTSGAVPVVMECDAHRLEAMEAPVPS